MNSSALIKLILIWTALALFFALILAGRDFLRYRQLANRGVRVSGTITQLEPANHHFVDYSYAVSQRVVSGRGHAGFGNPDFENLRVGDAVAVSYLPEDVNVSCLGDPRELLRHKERFMLGPVLVFPTLIVFFYYQRYPAFRAWIRV